MARPGDTATMATCSSHTTTDRVRTMSATETSTSSPAAEPGPPGASSAPALDLDGIARDLADVEAALARLDSGQYWTDEVTGGALSDELLAEQPTARRATPA